LDRPVNRRTAIGGLAVVGLATAQASPPDHAVPVIDLTALRDNLHALLKILASTDPREAVCHYAAGRVYACITGRAPIPLFGTHSISVARG
jgi:hypothetical protein